jgi:hypothetical protein
MYKRINRKNKIFIDSIMSYVNKNMQSKINHADACGGGGMKKAGLVYGNDWRRINRHTLLSNTPTNVTFSVYGQMTCNCGTPATTNKNPSQHAYRHTRTSFN